MATHCTGKIGMFFSFQDTKCDDCVVKRMMTLLTESKYKEHDISETTVREVFTNLILAGRVFSPVYIYIA